MTIYFIKHVYEILLQRFVIAGNHDELSRCFRDSIEWITTNKYVILSNLYRIIFIINGFTF
jgi:hypothetical protein